MAVKRLEEISEEIDIMEDNHERLIESAMIALGSKVVSNSKKLFARIAVDAVLDVADLPRKDVNFDLIKVHGKTGGSMEDSKLINGILIEKDMSHPQMRKEVKNA
jgi:T-complex protein 1 subunit epsilon